MFSSLLLRNLYYPLQLIFRPPASLPYPYPVKGDNGQVFSNHDQSHLYCYLEELVCQRQPQREKHSPGLGLRIRCVTGRRGHDRANGRSTAEGNQRSKKENFCLKSSNNAEETLLFFLFFLLYIAQEHELRMESA